MVSAVLLLLLLWREREVCEDVAALAGLFIAGGETLTQSFFTDSMNRLPSSQGWDGFSGVEEELQKWIGSAMRERERG